jgi:hypothetical protein
VDIQNTHVISSFFALSCPIVLLIGEGVLRPMHFHEIIRSGRNAIYSTHREADSKRTVKAVVRSEKEAAGVDSWLFL